MRGSAALPAATLDAVVSWTNRSLDEHVPDTRYGAALADALTLPGNSLSHDPNLRWARPVLVCCAACGGDQEAALPSAVAVELFMVALDLLDDEEDGEANALHAVHGRKVALNVSTGLLVLAQRILLAAPSGSVAARILLDAGWLPALVSTTISPSPPPRASRLIQR